MLDISNVYKQKIIHELIENRLEIVFLKKYDEQYEGSYELGYTPITEENIVSESMVLKQSICDEEKLKFGGCIASEFNIQLLNTAERSFDEVKLKDQWIVVALYQKHPTGQPLVCSPKTICGTNVFPGEIVTETKWILFAGYIDSARRSQEDRNVYEIVAYDLLSKLYEKGIRGKLRKKMKAGKSTCSELLPLCLSDGFYESDEFRPVGLLRNYDWEKDRDPITKGELLANICEVNGGFGFFRPSEYRLKLIKINKGETIDEIYDFYESLKVEETTAKTYNQILFPYGGDVYKEAVSETNPGGNRTALFSESYTNGFLSEEDDDFNLDNIDYYDMSDNKLAWDCSHESSTQNHLIRIKGISDVITGVDYGLTNTNNQLKTEYVPFQAVVDGRPWVEVGDSICFKTPRTNIYGEWLKEDGTITEDISEVAFEHIVSIVMSRTLKGIKALTDEIEAKGEVA